MFSIVLSETGDFGGNGGHDCINFGRDFHLELVSCVFERIETYLNREQILLVHKNIYYTYVISRLYSQRGKAEHIIRYIMSRGHFKQTYLFFMH